MIYLVAGLIKARYRETFDAVAAGYGHSAMRFFADSANRLVSYLDLSGDEHVLDVATGTGYAAFAIARQLPRGRVTAIDFSPGMLSQAAQSQRARGIGNISFTEMDMQSIDYRDNTFDVAVSAFSIFFVEEMSRQLRHIAEKVKAGGTVLTTTFFDNAFSPLVELFTERLEKYGIEVPSLAWKRVATEEQCTALFEDAGLQQTRCELKQCGYFLQDADDWWYIIWNGGFRGLVSQLSPADLVKFKQEHLADVGRLQSDRGLWLEMNVLYTFGKK